MVYKKGDKVRLVNTSRQTFLSTHFVGMYGIVLKESDINDDLVEVDWEKNERSWLTFKESIIIVDPSNPF